jgi:hypothetical protein
MRRWALVLLALSASPRAGRADAVCATRNGAMYARSRCRRHETAVSATLLGAPGSAGLPGPQGDRKDFPYRVIDAAGKEVGVIGLWPFEVVISPPATPRPLLFEVGTVLASAGTGGCCVDVFYKSQDCSGPPFVDVLGSDPSDFVPFASIYGTFAYYPVGPPATVQYASIEVDDYTSKDGCPGSETPTGRQTCCDKLPSPMSNDNLAPAAAIPVSSLGVTEPIRLVPR